MNSIGVRDKVNQFFINELEKGVVPWHQTWGSIQVSGANGRPYGGINQFILGIQKLNHGYASNRRLTFKAVQDLGGMVKKGEKSTLVVYYKLLEKKDLTETNGEIKKIPFLKFFLVFNLDQTTLANGEVKPANEVVTIEAAQHIIDNLSEEPVIIPGNPAYSPKTDQIKMPPKTEFHKPEEYYTTLLHELSHRTGAEKRLNREGIVKFDKFGSDQYSYEELIAEMSASYLSTFAGIEQNTKENSRAYIQGRLKAFQNDKNMLMKAASQGWKATEYILKGKENLLELFV